MHACIDDKGVIRREAHPFASTLSRYLGNDLSPEIPTENPTGWYDAERYLLGVVWHRLGILRADQECTTVLSLLRQGTLKFRTPLEARILAERFGALSPDEPQTVVALLELMINSIEHGNLAIDYRLKGKLLDEGRFEAEPSTGRTPGSSERGEASERAPNRPHIAVIVLGKNRFVSISPKNLVFVMALTELSIMLMKRERNSRTKKFILPVK